MVERVIGPTSHVFYSQRLKLHYVDWGNTDAPPLVLIHGGRDHCRTGTGWRRSCVAVHISPPTCAATGIRMVAAGNKALIDYVLDVAQLLEHLQLFPIT